MVCCCWHLVFVAELRQLVWCRVRFRYYWVVRTAPVCIGIFTLQAASNAADADYCYWCLLCPSVSLSVTWLKSAARAVSAGVTRCSLLSNHFGLLFHFVNIWKVPKQKQDAPLSWKYFRLFLLISSVWSFKRESLSVCCNDGLGAWHWQTVRPQKHLERKASLRLSTAHITPS